MFWYYQQRSSCTKFPSLTYFQPQIKQYISIFKKLLPLFLNYNVVQLDYTLLTIVMIMIMIMTVILIIIVIGMYILFSSIIVILTPIVKTETENVSYFYFILLHLRYNLLFPLWPSKFIKCCFTVEGFLVFHKIYFTSSQLEVYSYYRNMFHVFANVCIRILFSGIEINVLFMLL